MQEINLLQNKVKDQTLSWERRNRLIVTLFTLFLILEVLAGVGLFVLTKSTEASTKDVQKKNQTIQDSLNSSKNDLAKAKGVQAELANVQALLKNHIHWSAFFNKVASITPSKTQFQTITANTNDDKVILNGISPSYTDIGKLILSLSTSDNFSNVKLKGVSPGTGKTFGYNFVIELKASHALFLQK